MLSPKNKLLASPSTSGSFLAEWSKRTLPAYIEEYGGDRAGVAKGENIPFPPHKVGAAFALLAYGSHKYQTLAAVARKARVSGALLRVWRTEPRFIALYRRALWGCADDYLVLLSQSWTSELSPIDEFQKHFGVMLQHAILRRLLVDVLDWLPAWDPAPGEAKWVSEWAQINPPPNLRDNVPKDQPGLLSLNTFMLLSSALYRLGSRQPAWERWGATMVLRDFWVEHFVQHDLRATAEKCGCKEVLDSLDVITSQRAMDRYLSLFRLLSTKKDRPK